MAAFLVFDVQEITDPSAMAAYREEVRATVEAHGGRYRVIGGPIEVLEGSSAPTLPVIIEFASVEAARGWYTRATPTSPSASCAFARHAGPAFS